MGLALFGGSARKRELGDGYWPRSCAERQVGKRAHFPSDFLLSLQRW